MANHSDQRPFQESVLHQAVLFYLVRGGVPFLLEPATSYSKLRRQNRWLLAELPPLVVS